jgi:hypothetical protein
VFGKQNADGAFANPRHSNQHKVFVIVRQHYILLTIRVLIRQYWFLN